MEKFYRVKKDTPLWREGAIISDKNNGYRAIEDIWDTVKHNEYLGRETVEADGNTDFFERVYPDTITGKLYKTKDEMIELFKKGFSS